MSYITAVLPLDPEEDPEKFEQAKNCAQFAIEEHNKDKVFLLWLLSAWFVFFPFFVFLGGFKLI